MKMRQERCEKREKGKDDAAREKFKHGALAEVKDWS